ncbi:MAG: IS110 family transposase [Rhabdochlamydiaceae bacterium]
MSKLIIGIDIGKLYHQASVIDETGVVLGGSIRFPNTTAGAQLLLSRISSVNPGHLPLLFGLEATGHYWLNLYSHLTEKGYPISVINPYQSDAFRKVSMSSTKTDKQDATLIAELLRFGAFPQTKLAHESLVALRNLSRFRLTLSQQITDSKRRVITILDQVFPEFESCFSDIFGKTGRSLLKKYPTPEEMETVSVRRLTSIISKLSKGRFSKEKAQELSLKAKTSFGSTLALESLTLQLKILLENLEFTEKQLRIVDDQINPLVDDSCVLLTLPGVSKTIAASILSEIGDIKKFKTSSQLVSFAGINPTVRQSGNFLGNKNHMSKKGSPYLRLALWQASITSARFNPVLKEYYQLKIKEGKSHMTVIGAVARKLTGIIFAMLRDQTVFTV